MTEYGYYRYREVREALRRRPYHATIMTYAAAYALRYLCGSRPRGAGKVTSLLQLRKHLIKVFGSRSIWDDPRRGHGSGYWSWQRDVMSDPNIVRLRQVYLGEYHNRRDRGLTGKQLSYLLEYLHTRGYLAIWNPRDHTTYFGRRINRIFSELLQEIPYHVYDRLGRPHRIWSLAELLTHQFHGTTAINLVFCAWRPEINLRIREVRNTERRLRAELYRFQRSRDRWVQQYRRRNRTASYSEAVNAFHDELELRQVRVSNWYDTLTPMDRTLLTFAHISEPLHPRRERYRPYRRAVEEEMRFINRPIAPFGEGIVEKDDEWATVRAGREAGEWIPPRRRVGSRMLPALPELARTPVPNPDRWQEGEHHHFGGKIHFKFTYTDPRYRYSLRPFVPPQHKIEARIAFPHRMPTPIEVCAIISKRLRLGYTYRAGRWIRNQWHPDVERRRLGTERGGMSIHGLIAANAWRAEEIIRDELRIRGASVAEGELKINGNRIDITGQWRGVEIVGSVKLYDELVTADRARKDAEVAEATGGKLLTFYTHPSRASQEIVANVDGIMVVIPFARLIEAPRYIQYLEKRGVKPRGVNYFRRILNRGLDRVERILFEQGSRKILQAETEDSS